jgi:ribonuclease VapC
MPALRFGMSWLAPQGRILGFLDLAQVRIEAVDMSVTAAAISAFDRYGRRSGHPADLNMGDCFTYAFASSHKIDVLYKGKDFALTDVKRLARDRNE